VQLLKYLGLPELTNEQTEKLCLKAETTARKYVQSKISKKAIETFDINVEAQGTKPIILAIDVNIALSPSVKNLDVQKLANESIQEAFKFAEEYLRELKCHSQK